MSFFDWLHAPEPEWKGKLETCDPKVFEELELDKLKVEGILEKLKEYNVI